MTASSHTEVSLLLHHDLDLSPKQDCGINVIRRTDFHPNPTVVTDNQASVLQNAHHV